ncbi:UTRA domain-containing protein [Notoacmeibacter sp. MSK16QG-6]|uniref:UTRA domain-containing protein n=1 Tax=Notoacmeibacter sp. MSK16QG-6 TaxID=2957982 RepID=UPI00209E6BFE
MAQHPTSRIVLDIPIIQLEVEQRGAEWRHALVETAITVPPVGVSGRLGLKPETTMRHVRSLHFADNQPFLLEDRWINIDAIAGAETADFAAMSSNEWLIQNAPYTSGDIAFSATNADSELAELLEAEAGSALFTVNRITWNKDVPITSVVLFYAPGYRMISRI